MMTAMEYEPDLAVFVFIDALGWEIFSKHGLLDDVWAITAPQETILGYSCTCDPTILTGCLPSEHGHFSFYLNDEKNSPFRGMNWLNALPSRIVDRGRVRRWLSRAVAAWHGFDGYFQLYETPFEYLPYFDYSEKRDIYQPGGINGGQPTIFDELRARDMPFSLSDWRQSESDNLNKLRRDIQTDRPSFAYLYLAGLDGILHKHGTESAEVARHLAYYDAQLRDILAFAGDHYRDVRMYVFSDHGMTNVHQHLDLMRHLKALPLEFGKDYVAYLDSTMARFWFRNAAAADQVQNCLKEIKNGRVLGEHQLKEYGILFADQRYGELIFLCDPGVLICPSFMGRKPMAGMHGYDPGHHDSSAMIACSVDDCPVPKRLDEMYDLMHWELNRLNSNPMPALTAGAR
jgi:predicted AlkP superfamily pyrophosphatase or phosphodiesterase